MASTKTIELTDESVGTLQIGEHSVRRLGFGAMRITGEGIWGPRQTTMRRSPFSAVPWSWASI